LAAVCQFTRNTPITQNTIPTSAPTASRSLNGAGIDWRPGMLIQYAAAGVLADAAYVLAGYRENRSNAARLTASQGIQRRVAEIHHQTPHTATNQPIRTVSETSHIAIFSSPGKLSAFWTQKGTQAVACFRASFSEDGGTGCWQSPFLCRYTISHTRQDDLEPDANSIFAQIFYEARRCADHKKSG
jgi:hypothetical protein